MSAQMDGGEEPDAEVDRGEEIGLIKQEPRTYRVPVEVTNPPRYQCSETLYVTVEADCSHCALEIAERRAKKDFQIVWGVKQGGEYRNLVRREWSNGTNSQFHDLGDQGGVTNVQFQ